MYIDFDFLRTAALGALAIVVFQGLPRVFKTIYNETANALLPSLSGIKRAVALLFGIASMFWFFMVVGLIHWQHDFFDVSSTGTWDALLGNLFFLQGIVSPSFGSNAALWSLSFEFWYYLTFPILLLLFFSTKPLGLRAGYASVALILLMVFAPNMARYFPIWLLGVVVGLLPPSGWLARRPIPWLTGAALGFVVLVTLEHSTRVKRVLGESVYALDWVTGLAFAVCLYGILHDRRPAFAGRYATISKALASCSFTLYVIHLPILVLVRAHRDGRHALASECHVDRACPWRWRPECSPWPMGWLRSPRRTRTRSADFSRSVPRMTPQESWTKR